TKSGTSKACEITEDLDIDKAGLPHQSGDRICLGRAEFDAQPAAWNELTWRGDSDGAVGIEAVGAADQRDLRIMIADLDWQAGELRLGHVWRVGEDQVEGRFAGAMVPASLHKTRPRIDVESQCVIAGHAKGFFRYVDADATRVAPLSQDGNQDTART